MDDIMILMHKLVLDVQGFGEENFLIFPEAEQTDIQKMWTDEAHGVPQKFISRLSPSQMHCLVRWAVERSEYDIPDIIVALEKFLKYLRSKSGSYAKYPLVKKPKKLGKYPLLLTSFSDTSTNSSSSSTDSPVQPYSTSTSNGLLMAGKKNLKT